jgi:hypothetical protein
MAQPAQTAADSSNHDDTYVTLALVWKEFQSTVEIIRKDLERLDGQNQV